MIKNLRYFIEFIIVKLLFCFFRLFSIDQASDIGAGITRFIGPKLAISNIAKNNIKKAMPEKTNQEITEIIINMWDNIGRVAAEFSHIFNLSQQEFQTRLKIEGLENIPSNHKGLIFFSGHFANWEITPRLPNSLGIKTALIYRHANNKYVDNIMRQERSKNNIDIIPKGYNNVRNIIKHLKDGHSLAMLVDQKMNDGISVPFFNIPSMTANAIAKMAKTYNCPIIPSQIIRGVKANFILKFYPAIQYQKTNNSSFDNYQILLQINQILEKWIREYPGQWLWLHNRWSKK